MKRMITILIIIALTLTAGSVFGLTSSTSITSTMTGADGVERSMSGIVSMLGYNYASSTNTLWIELYKSETGPDTRISGSQMAIGGTASWANNVASGIYYVHLDPDGPFYTGCNGYGEAVNN
ncbi:MAG: hypothetical protein QHH10_13125 [Peptococcaceae bacterium]|jgi:hypothetical protein|nr:hypothetical protein [Peptococcaceae bacterium]MDH7526241.1 hypothetical protein [Peptococcaceae bacterium]